MNDDDSFKEFSSDLGADTSTVPGVGKCLKAFGVLLTAVDDVDRAKISSLRPAVMEHNGRFRVWSGNIGAHQTGKSSLNHRLRETPYIKTRILRLLKDLNELLNEAIAIVTGTRQALEFAIPEERSSDSETDPEEDDPQRPKSTEIQQIFTEILEIINCLYRLSMSVRNPTGTQRYVKSAHIDTSFYEPYDVEHVRQLFPHAKEYLVERLGMAVSRRRQYLKYRETHAAKLARHLDGKDTATTLSETTASALLVHGIVQEDAKSVTSEVSGATSIGSVQKARMPSMPQAARDRQHFECPHCRTIECVLDSNSWIKHVYKDLQPYMCTYEKCKTPHEMYEGRRQWFNHELQQHRRSWSCNGHCDRKFDAGEALIAHIKKVSPGLYSDVQLSTLVEIWASPMDTDAKSLCPLCSLEAIGTIQTRRHLGRHLEEIALFALPKDSTEFEDDEVDQASTDVSDRMFPESDEKENHDVLCDVCGARAPINYHCSICSNDNCDICEACYDQDVWCLDHSHPLLKRLGRNNQFNKKQYYYSNHWKEDIPSALSIGLSENMESPPDTPSEASEIEDINMELPPGIVNRGGRRFYEGEYGCGKRFTRMEHRKRHEANHLSKPRFKCEVNECQKPFQRMDLMARHMKRQHGIPQLSSLGPILREWEDFSYGDESPGNSFPGSSQEPRDDFLPVTTRPFGKLKRSRSNKSRRSMYVLDDSAPEGPDSQVDESPTLGLSRFGEELLVRNDVKEALVPVLEASYFAKSGDKEQTSGKILEMIEDNPDRGSAERGGNDDVIDRLYDKLLENLEQQKDEPSDYGGNDYQKSEAECYDSDASGHHVPAPDKDSMAIKSALKAPGEIFPEHRNAIHDRVSSLKYSPTPKNARWTKIDRELVNPEALDSGSEKYDVHDDHVVVQGVLTKEGVEVYAQSTRTIRDQRWIHATRKQRQGELENDMHNYSGPEEYETAVRSRRLDELERKEEFEQRKKRLGEELILEAAVQEATAKAANQEKEELKKQAIEEYTNLQAE
ncbi:hypothetical protein MMC18_000751 [Xylographa bjoerkii]|nr:hypothetical protein [Xylographa bjoerkii]